MKNLVQAGGVTIPTGTLPPLPQYMQDLVDAVAELIEKFDSEYQDLAAAVKALEEHKGDKNNPHNVQKSDLNLENVDNVRQAPLTRKINTSGAMSGGGDLSKDLTLTVASASTTVKGVSKLNDEINSRAEDEAATANAARKAYNRGSEGLNSARDAHGRIDDLEGEMVGQFKHLGGIDLSGGKYPPKPDFSAIWHVQVGGNVDATTHVANASTRSSMEYEEGDSLVFSIDLDMFYKVKDKASISSDEVYDKFLQKTGKAADTGKVDGKDARYVNHGTDIRGMIAGSLNETPERGGFVDGTDGSANPTGNRSIGFQAVGSSGTRMFQLISPTVNTEVWFRSKNYQNGDWRGWGRFFSTLDKPKVDDVSGLKGELDKKSNTGHGHSDLVKKSGDSMTGNLNISGSVAPFIPTLNFDALGNKYPIGVSLFDSMTSNGFPDNYNTVATFRHGSHRQFQLIFPKYGRKAGYRTVGDGGEWSDLHYFYSTVDKPTAEEIGAAEASHNHNDDYAAKTHTHSISQVTDLQSKLDGKSDTGHKHDNDYAAKTHKHDNDYAAKTHSHSISQVTDLQSKLDGKSDTGHKHDNDYAAKTHSHSISQVTDLQSKLDGKSDTGHKHDNDYAAKTHSHSISQVTNLQGELNKKSNTGHHHDNSYAAKAHKHDDYAARTHSHSINQITNLQGELNKKSNTGHKHDDYSPKKSISVSRLSGEGLDNTSVNVPPVPSGKATVIVNFYWRTTGNASFTPSVKIGNSTKNAARTLRSGNGQNSTNGIACFFTMTFPNHDFSTERSTRIEAKFNQTGLSDPLIEISVFD